MSRFLNTSRIFSQYAVSGLSRDEPSAADGEAATASRVSDETLVRSTKSSFMMPLTACTAPYSLSMPGCFTTCSITPTREALITPVGPPDWLTIAFAIFLTFLDISIAFLFFRSGHYNDFCGNSKCC